mmetsp:Transcript_13197/g.30674  ORF Transcript_13197/g.30674 Transcript_13197/m.30674 type:complete len:83 (-) Transcript_13197:731-979(-)
MPLPQRSHWFSDESLTDLSLLGKWGNLSVRPEQGWYTPYLILLSLFWTAVILSLLLYEQCVFYLTDALPRELPRAVKEEKRD